MIRRLFFLSALLLPRLAYGDDPSVDLSVNVVPPVPAGAEAAKFTTLAFNADFSQGMDIGCYPTTAVHQLYQGGPSGSAVQVPCSYLSLVQDGGQQVLDMKWTPSLDPLGFFGANAISTLNTNESCSVANPGCTVTGTDFGAAYYEAVFRVQTTPATTASAPTTSGFLVGGLWYDFFTWWTNFYSGDNNGVEYDVVEDHGDQPLWVEGDCINWGTSKVGCGYAWGGTAPIAGFDFTQYHTYGMRITSDGSTATEMCGYLDNNFMGCVNANATGTEFTNRIYPMLNIGWGCNYQNGQGNCQGAQITNVYPCTGSDAPQICITVNTSSSYGSPLFNQASYLQYPASGNLASISGVQGITSANGVWYLHLTSEESISDNVNQVLVGSTWPGGVYTAGTGLVNAYTEEDMFVKSIRVWSCASWQTSFCNGKVLTGAP
jgi:hypothetical protein